MDVTRYSRLVRFFNSILLNKKSYSTFAVHNLNILRYHPNYLNYAEKTEIKKSRYFKKFLKKKINKADILFISNIFDTEKKPKKQIFNDISQYSNKNKIHFIYRNFTGKKFQYNFSNKTILNINASLKLDIIYFFKLLLEVIKIFIKNFSFYNYFFLKSLFTIKNFKSSISTMYEVNELINILKKVNPRKIFMSFEGYSWERMLIYRIKKFNPEIKTYGYFFSIITRYQNSPFIKYGECFDFDYILTSGIPQKKKFINHKFKKEKIIIIGKEFYKESIFRKNMLNNKKCLILPESFKEEIFFMLDFVKKCSDKKLDIEFYIKLHPSMNNKKIKEKIFNYYGSNIKIISRENVNFRYALFRGTSAIVDYIKKGSQPLYLKKKNEPDLNPLYEISNEIKYITQPEDFKKLLKSKKIFSKSSKLNKYCKNYFNKLNKNKLLNLLK